MARARKKKTRKSWTGSDVKDLRTLAGKKSARTIAQQLKRTEGAVRQKALTLRVSLRVR
jgi:hypothetical protein